MKTMRTFLVSLAALALAACGGSDNTLLVPGGSSGDGGGGGEIAVELGNGTPENFFPGEIDVAVRLIDAGGNTSLSVALVQSNQTYYTGSVDVEFASDCIDNGQATVTPNTATTSTGTATVTYLATGCSGPDAITATARINGQTLTATGTVTVRPPPPPTVEMGSGSPSAFTAGQIAVAVPSLAAGGSTSLSLAFIQTDYLNVSSYYTNSVNVTFSSACIANNLATVTPNPASTSTGAVTVTYSANGCSGADVVTAAATTNGQSLSATGTVTVAAAAVGSIQFISATPTKIGLQGTGGVGLPETSTVIFRVVDSTGGPVAGASVSFALDTSVGGITRTPATATSGADGNVQTVVASGTVATSVRVTATVTSVVPNIATQSSQLVVTTGLPDQDSFSLAVQCPNVEAFNVDGVQVPVTVRLADRFNNPVPNGTAVTFNAEAGSIAGSCVTTTTSTESGVCTVNWTSAGTRPPDGRVTLLATAIGEETFADVNGNGYFDNPDSFPVPVNSADVGDLPEAFRDDNENSTHDPGEFFFDFDQDSSYGTGDGLFNGLLCQDTGGRCGTSDKTGIFASNLIVMSTSGAVISDNVGGALTAPNAVTFTVVDENGQVMPAGTKVTASVTNGKLVGTTSYTVPCATTPGPGKSVFPFTVDEDTNTVATGFFFLEVESPDGLITPYTITVAD